MYIYIDISDKAVKHKAENLLDPGLVPGDELGLELMVNMGFGIRVTGLGIIRLMEKEPELKLTYW